MNLIMTSLCAITRMIVYIWQIHPQMSGYDGETMKRISRKVQQDLWEAFTSQHAGCACVMTRKLFTAKYQLIDGGSVRVADKQWQSEAQGSQNG